MSDMLVGLTSAEYIRLKDRLRLAEAVCDAAKAVRRLDLPFYDDEIVPVLESLAAWETGQGGTP
jgi:hypothetical protein